MKFILLRLLIGVHIKKKSQLSCRQTCHIPISEDWVSGGVGFSMVHYKVEKEQMSIKRPSL